MILFERRYNLKDGGQILLKFFDPVEGEDGYRCRLVIEWPSGRVTDIHGSGFDRLDALLHAVALARINIETCEEWQEGNVTCMVGHDASTDPFLEVPIPPGFLEAAREWDHLRLDRSWQPPDKS
jgi:hypothetical protein